HEFGSYYCSLPDISLISKFTGVIDPTWLDQKKRWVEDSQLATAYSQYVQNSQRLQMIGRKYQIERARRNSDVTGYHYWLILDYPGGTGEGDSWEEGWFDYFWRPKNIEPREGQEVNSAVLLMIGAGVGDRTMWNDARKSVDVLVSNYGDDAIRDGSIAWRLESAGRLLASGSLTEVNAGLGEVRRVGALTIGPVGSAQAQKLTLVLTLQSGARTYTNRWNLWSFPRDLARSVATPVTTNLRWAGLPRLYPFIGDGGSRRPDSLSVTSALDREAADLLKHGGTVLLLADRAQFERSGDASFFPASGGALGTVVAQHPALNGFPHDGMFDLQFYNLLEGAWSFSIDQWPKEVVPIAGGIRTTSSFLSKTKNLSKVGYIVEAKVGQGKLLMTTLRIREHLDEAFPEAIYLFDRLLRYAGSTEFRPATALDDRQLERLIVQ
ncbi:MAG TPA: hypothetical protein VFL57_00940, partial [Bryobacteraceae bacterium]|nr:hypothetical protein [Bryobacteraceae bacterium]